MAAGVRFGLVVPQGWRLDLTHLEDPGAQFETLVEVAKEAERLGFDSIWLYDHLQAREGQPQTTFECWVTLAALARETRTVRLGQLVTCNLYRNPALLAKMASTLDSASGGRAVVGLGAGWDAVEYVAYGYDAGYPSLGERLRRLDEAAQVVLGLWAEQRASFAGELYALRGAVNVPAGIQQPHIPLMIGGAGEQVLLRLVARHADACNLTDSTDPAYYRRKLSVLRSHCDEVGREYDTILKTASFTVFAAETEALLARRLESVLDGRSRAELAAGSAVGTPSQLVELFQSLVDAGIDYFIVYLQRPTDLDTLRLFAHQVMPALRA
jgi:F420-dependent oxidoreductase-like protein